jgi:UDP-N-acetylmuramoylalanine-D-glutamate ligase
LTPGSGTDRLTSLLHNTPVNWSIVEHLEAAVAEAKQGSENGDIILFSPAFASFAQYKNEYERNDEFMALVDKV